MFEQRQSQWQGAFADVVGALGLHRLAFEHPGEIQDAAQEAKENLNAFYLQDGLSHAAMKLIERREFLRCLDTILQPQVDAACAQQRPELEAQVVAAAMPSKPVSTDSWMDPAKWVVKGALSVEDEAYVLGCAAEASELQDGLIQESYRRQTI